MTNTRTRRILWCVLLLASCGTADDEVADTRFKYERGFYGAPFLQVIRSKTPGAKIRYTLDGSAPTESHGSGDTNPVTVPVETTTTLRAIAYKEGMTSTNVDTQTYIFLDDVVKQPRLIEGYPTSLAKPGMGYLKEFDYEMDPDVVNDPSYRDELVPGLESIPTVSIVMDRDDLFGPDGVYFSHRGRGAEKAASVEIFEASSDASKQIDCAVESHASLGVKRSLKLKFKKKFGPSKLETTLFENAPLNGDSAAHRVRRIVLRAGHTRSWTGENPDTAVYTRDQWVRDSQIAMSGVGAHGTFIHLYLNGLYWGVYNAVERPEASFSAEYLGGDKDDWFAANHNGKLSGDGERWRYLRRELTKKDLSVAENYEELQGYLDVTHFADYIILGWYSRLDDWGPDRNWYGGNRTRPSGPFRFYMWDAEYSLFAGSSAMAWVHEQFRRDVSSGSKGMVGIFHALVENPDFMTLFADRVYRHCYDDGVLTESRAIERWRRLNDFVSSALIAESARWGDAREVFGEKTRTRDGNVIPEVEKVTHVMTGNVARFIAVLRDEGYYPAVDPPDFDVAGPRVRLVNSNASGVVYYTLDGSDPRSPGGAVSSSARRAGEDVLESPGVVRARVLSGHDWSALRELGSR